MIQVLNYHDAVVYDTDVGLFGDGGWLNDNCINWFFRLLEHEAFPEKHELLFMDPSVVSCMLNQCDEPDEFVDLARGIELESRNKVFIPVNNSQGLLSRGSHWSLLVFERGDSSTCFKHYDSSEGSNRRPAERTATKFMQMLGGTAGSTADAPSVEHVRGAPQQQNANDCGMYTILVAEHVAAKAVAADLGQTEEAVSTWSGAATAAALADMSPEFVANARTLARVRLVQCVRSQGKAP